MSRVAILGAGAVGCAVGAALSRRGHEVTLVGRLAQVEAIRSAGLSVDGRWGSFTVRPQAATLLEFRPEYAFLTVKTQDVLRMLGSNLPFLRETPLVTFQNGVRSDGMAASLLPRLNIVSAVVNISATYLEPGRLTLIYPGTLMIGRPFAEGQVPLEPLRAMLAGVTRTTITPNIRGAHWLKLLFNLNNALPALTNTGLHELYARPQVRELSARVIR